MYKCFYSFSIVQQITDNKCFYGHTGKDDNIIVGIKEEEEVTVSTDFTVSSR